MWAWQMSLTLSISHMHAFCHYIHLVHSCTAVRTPVVMVMSPYISPPHHSFSPQSVVRETSLPPLST